MASTARQLQGIQSIPALAHDIGCQGVQDTAQHFSCDDDVCFQTILDSICVLGGGTSSAGTLVHHLVDLVNIYNEFDNRSQQLMYIHFNPGSVCAGFYRFQHDNFRVMRPV